MSVYLCILTESVLIASLSYIIFNFDISGSLFVNIQNNISLIGGEFRLNTANLFIGIILLILHLIIFINTNYEIIGRQTKAIEHRKYFFSIYLINLFSLVGVMFTSNICNFYIFLEIYSFTLYTIGSDSKSKKMIMASFENFINNTFGSILILLSIFGLVIYFGSTNILFINQKMLSIDIYQNPVLVVIYVLSIAGICIKFFLTQITIPYKNIGKVNFLNFMNTFVGSLLGIYSIVFISNEVFNLANILEYIPFKFIIYFIAIGCMFFSIYKIIKQTSLTIIFLNSIFIDISLIFIAIADNETNSIYLALLFMIEYATIDLILFLIANYCILKYHTNKLEVLIKEKVLKKIFYFTLLSKICLPLGAGFFINKTIINMFLSSKFLILFFAFILAKIAYMCVIYKIYRIKESNKNIEPKELPEHYMRQLTILKYTAYSSVLLVICITPILTKLKNLIY